MAELIKMPRLSDTMEEGTVAAWFKKVGDKVQEGEILAEIETDKATMEFESFYEGTLLYIGIKENETAKVDAPLAIIGDPGEDINSILAEQTNKSEKPNEIEDSEPPKKSSNDSEKTVEKPMNDDIHVITMPRLSDTMEEGTVASWFKKVGEGVEEGEILAEIETDKATMEFESFYSGTLLHIGLNDGDSAKVDSLLAIIGPSGADISQYLNGSVKIESEDSQKEELKIEQKAENKIIQEKDTFVKTPETVKSERIFISPLAKKLAKDKNYYFTTKDSILIESLINDGIQVPEKYLSLLELYTANIPTDIQVMINDNESGVILLRLVEIIGEDNFNDLGSETQYFIISTLNQLKSNKLRNELILKILPFKV